MAKKYMQLRGGLPNGCMEKEANWKTVFKNAITTILFTSNPTKDECLQYSKSILMEPLFEVSPITAVMTTGTNLILVPINLGATTFNNVFRTIFTDIPYPLIPVLVLMLLYTFTFILVTAKKYTVSFLFFNIKPYNFATANPDDDEDYYEDDNNNEDDYHHHYNCKKLTSTRKKRKKIVVVGSKKTKKFYSNKK